jgi:hypothetical protein
MLAYEVLTEGVEPEAEAVTSAIRALLEVRGDKLRNEGVPVEDEAEVLAIIRENVNLILSLALPMWRRVGAI